MSRRTFQRHVVALATLLAVPFAWTVAVPGVAHAAPNEFSLVSRLNNKCLDIKNFNPRNAATLQMYSCLGGANQKWYWDGEQLRSSMNRKCLDIKDFNARNGAAVQMYSCLGGANLDPPLSV